MRRPARAAAGPDPPGRRPDAALIAMSRISEADARDQMEMLRRLGESDPATDEVTGYGLGDRDDGPVRR